MPGGRDDRFTSAFGAPPADRKGSFERSALQVEYAPLHGGHGYTARLGGEEVGWMNLTENGEVQHVATHPERRRQGIATALWEHAVHHANQTGGEVPWPQHSTDRTYEGDRWAKSMGEDVPPLYKIGTWPTPPVRTRR